VSGPLLLRVLGAAMPGAVDRNLLPISLVEGLLTTLRILVRRGRVSPLQLAEVKEWAGGLANQEVRRKLLAVRGDC
jgi:hypothetical protein